MLDQPALKPEARATTEQGRCAAAQRCCRDRDTLKVMAAANRYADAVLSPDQSAEPRMSIRPTGPGDNVQPAPERASFALDTRGGHSHSAVQCPILSAAASSSTARQSNDRITKALGRGSSSSTVGRARFMRVPFAAQSKPVESDSRWIAWWNPVPDAGKCPAAQGL